MSKRFLASRFLLAAPLLLCPALTLAQDQARIPIQVEIVRSIDSARSQVGDTVFAKVSKKWQSPQCNLREGAVLQGRIVAAAPHSKATHTSQIALLFDTGQCNGRDMKPLPLTVAAVLAFNPFEKDDQYKSRPLSDAVGLSVGGLVGGPSGASLRGVASGGLRSVSAAAATVELSPTEYVGPTSVMPGQVLGIKGVKLDVGGGPEGSSILSTSGHNVHLESGSQLVLVPNLKAASPSVSAMPAATAPTTPAVSPSAAAPPVASAAAAATDSPEEDETEVCSPPNCSIALTPNESDVRVAAASTTLALNDLGYTPARPDHEMFSFDYSSAISYLGPHQVLFSFDPHILIQRTVAESNLSDLRIIRAVLVNVQEKKVEKTVDWKVTDARQYQWPVSHDRVLVHVGRELRLYGPGLKLQQRISLNGPLAFVRVSPSSTYFAIGQLQERHSAIVHRQLQEAEGREPEEDVELKILDADFHVLATVLRSSRAAPPVLSDHGEIRLRRLTKSRWQIVEIAWDEQRRTLATLNSTCSPNVTPLPPDLFFVVGCDRETTGKWFRVLGSDGKPVLKGWSASADPQQTASGIPAGSDFAIAMAQASKSIAADSAFFTSDLELEHIAVYQASNGERMLAVTIPSPTPSVQTFALSPDGAQLAVLQGNQLAFYAVPSAANHR